jgi:hypothetical protein
MTSERQDARGRRFTVSTAKKYRTAQKQLDLFKDASTKTEEGEPQGEADRRDDGKTVPDPTSD